MVRAELGVGNLDAASALLRRIKARFVTWTLFVQEFLLIDCQTIPRGGV